MKKDETNIHSRLKAETLEQHKEAEYHPIMQSFVSGNYKKEHLLCFLVNILPIYQIIEQRLLSEQILKNRELERSPLIQKDIMMIETDLGIDGISKKNITPFKHTQCKVSDLWIEDEDALKACLYVRWLADLYGGRILGKSVSPYNNMYNYETPSKTIEDIRNIVGSKSKYITDNMLILKAREFFIFHVELFNLIQKC